MGIGMEVYSVNDTVIKDEQLLGKVASELAIPQKQVKSVISLLGEGNTVPFIARYRKEMTGALDEVQIRTILERWQYIQNLEQRKEEVLRIIEEQGKLTAELSKAITNSEKLQEVEDLYRPYKQKRRTKATVAKEKGLESFSEWLMTFPKDDVEQKAKEFLSEDKQVLTIEEAIAGAKDIIAEMVSDDAEGRKWIRKETFKSGTVASVVKDAGKDEKNVYEMYYEYEEPVSKIVPHRILALNRGEKEDVLRASIKMNAELILT